MEAPRLPPALERALGELLGQAPQQLRPHPATLPAATLQAGGTRWLVKWTADPGPPGWPDPVSAEARDLALLASVGAVRVPAVRAAAAAHAGCPAFAIVAWVETFPAASRPLAGERLGQQLAALHRHSAASYGLDYHNYCGATPQPNAPQATWAAFYATQRLLPLAERAVRLGRMPAARRRALEQVLERLPQLLPEPPEGPALIHGDLWSGNWLVGPAGQPVLIDPAASFSHREVELAMCRLFGGFPPALYAAYDEAWPPDPGRDERVELLQLGHLLNHLVLFGESYGAAVDAVLQKYGGCSPPPQFVIK